MKQTQQISKEDRMFSLHVETALSPQCHKRFIIHYETWFLSTEPGISPEHSWVYQNKKICVHILHQTFLRDRVVVQQVEGLCCLWLTQLNLQYPIQSSQSRQGPKCRPGVSPDHHHMWPKNQKKGKKCNISPEPVYASQYVKVWEQSLLRDSLKQPNCHYL